MANDLEQTVADSGDSQSLPEGSAPEQPTAESSQGVEDSFFDPKSLAPELQSTYKKMQAAYTRKAQAIARERDKVSAYDDFMRDPHTSIRRVAAEYGIQLNQADPTQRVSAKDWVPSDWNEVLSKSAEHASPRIREEIMGHLQPVISEFQKMKQREIEKELDNASPDWRLYEDEMVSLLRQHPSLVNDPKLLAKLSLPDQVTQSRAAEAALKKVQRKVESARNSTGSTTSRTPEPNTSGPMTFNQAVALAKSQLAKKGIVY